MNPLQRLNVFGAESCGLLDNGQINPQLLKVLGGLPLFLGSPFGPSFGPSFGLTTGQALGQALFPGEVVFRNAVQFGSHDLCDLHLFAYVHPCVLTGFEKEREQIVRELPQALNTHIQLSS